MGLGDNIVLLSTNVDLGRDKIFNKIKKGLNVNLRPEIDKHYIL